MSQPVVVTLHDKNSVTKKRREGRKVLVRTDRVDALIPYDDLTILFIGGVYLHVTELEDEVRRLLGWSS